MEIQRTKPHPALRDVARAFEERRANLGSAGLTWPVPARPHQILDIHLAEPYRVRRDGGPPSVTPETFIVGPQSYRRAEVCLSGQVHVFNILFQPTGLHRLIGIDMASLADRDAAASDVIGHVATALSDAVRAAPDFAARVAVTERWLGSMLDRRGPESAIGHASRLLIASGGRARIDRLAERAGLSPRQFQRGFGAQVGLAPKLYARTIRFDRALVAHRVDPSRSWTDIVHDAGYFDQAHFIRECHALAGIPPSRFTADWKNIFFPADG